MAIARPPRLDRTLRKPHRQRPEPFADRRRRNRRSARAFCFDRPGHRETAVGDGQTRWLPAERNGPAVALTVTVWRVLVYRGGMQARRDGPARVTAPMTTG